MKIAGKAVKFGDSVDTDVILPGRYLTLTDPAELAKHAMEGIDPTFPQKAKEGVIIVAGRNFGCGSSREQAPLALKHAGVKCIVAESFARIFYRNAINIGLPILECKEAKEKIEEEDELLIDLDKGTVADISRGLTLRTTPLIGLVREILDEGGLVNYLKKRKWKWESTE